MSSSEDDDNHHHHHESAAAAAAEEDDDEEEMVVAMSDEDNDDNDQHEEDEEKLEVAPASSSSSSKKKKEQRRPLSQEDLQNFQAKLEKRGIIYISRIPPGMTPTTVRRYMSQFGTVHRIFLAPENQNSAKKRRKHGGNRGKRYTEGWVEFGRKKIAKAVAASLNNTQIGGRRRSNYHDDLWNIKYLKHFKWHHMTEQAAYAKAVRETRIREEMTQSRKETSFYIQKVQQSKAINAMAERRKKRKRDDGDDDDDEESGLHRRRFRQRPSVNDNGDGASGNKKGALDEKVLKQILPAS